VDDVLVDKLVAFGCVSVMDVDEIGPEPLVKELDLEAELAERVVEAAGEEVIRGREEEPVAKDVPTEVTKPADENAAPSSFVDAGTTAAAADTAAASVSAEEAPAAAPDMATPTPEATGEAATDAPTPVDAAVPGTDTPSETPPSALTPAPPTEEAAPPPQPADKTTGLSPDQPEEAAVTGQVKVEPPARRFR
jgi:hypothetical protein